MERYGGFTDNSVRKLSVRRKKTESSYSINLDLIYILYLTLMVAQWLYYVVKYV